MVGIVAVLRNFQSSGLEVEDRAYICQRHESESVCTYNLVREYIGTDVLMEAVSFR